MNSRFQDEIAEDINWRYSELSILRTLPFRYGISNSNKDFLIRYSVPIIYSLWEGFVKSAFECYVREINLLKLSASNMNSRLLAHAINSEAKLNLQNPRVLVKTRVEFTESLLIFLGDSIQISSVIPTASNINFEILNDLLYRFNLDLFSVTDFKGPLNKLIRFRNSVSHGDNSIPVTATDIETFCKLVNDLMTEVYSKLEEGFNNNSYLK